MSLALVFALLCGLAAVAYGIYTTKQVTAASAGNERMQEIAAAIQEGASAYLNRQYMAIGVAGVVVGGILLALLGLPVPLWYHHGLLTDESGLKLAKRRGSPSLADRRRSGENGQALADAVRSGEFPAGITLANS